MKPFFVVIFSNIRAYIVALWKDIRVLGISIGILLQVAVVGAYLYYQIPVSIYLIQGFITGWVLMVICFIAWGRKYMHTIKNVQNEYYPLPEKKNPSSWTTKK